MSVTTRTGLSANPRFPMPMTRLRDVRLVPDSDGNSDGTVIMVVVVFVG